MTLPFPQLWNPLGHCQHFMTLLLTTGIMGPDPVCLVTRASIKQILGVQMEAQVEPTQQLRRVQPKEVRGGWPQSGPGLGRLPLQVNALLAW